MNELNNKEVIAELQKTNKLLALIVTQGKAPNEKITLLEQADFSPKEIADLLGITANQVSVTLSRERKKQNNKDTKPKVKKVS